jgi:hypothetical protein
MDRHLFQDKVHGTFSVSRELKNEKVKMAHDADGVSRRDPHAESRSLALEKKNNLITLPRQGLDGRECAITTMGSRGETLTLRADQWC